MNSHKFHAAFLHSPSLLISLLASNHFPWLIIACLAPAGYGFRQRPQSQTQCSVGNGPCPGRQRQQAHISWEGLPGQTSRERAQEEGRAHLPGVCLWPRRGAQQRSLLQHHRRQRGRKVLHRSQNSRFIVQEGFCCRDVQHSDCMWPLTSSYVFVFASTFVEIRLHPCSNLMMTMFDFMFMVFYAYLFYS